MRKLRESFSVLLLGILAGACAHRIVTTEALPASPTGAQGEILEQTDELQSRDDKSSISSEKYYFDWPVDQARMTRGYLPFRKKPHLGIDLAAPRGTKIYASHDGVVIYTGREFKGYGKMVMIEGPDGWASLYAHFSKISVKEGQTIRQGELVGAMGSTGRSTGSHLHFEIRKLKGPVDPLLYLPRIKNLAVK